ncbi:hypothetical protein L6164_030541 [Bauhinia variegata]|uniref:Uncharacterized protein n=1 Tax=Bauhinia variegata TaxID=167791 RepID=A0ACB9LDJ0_BAUVA|nr:hypothetical protein L6164_030541 [Bauhinia variegata]
MNQQHHVNNNQLQQSNLGGTTLDDFLVRASFVGNQDNNSTVPDAHPHLTIDPRVMSQRAEWLPLQMIMPNINQQQQQQQMRGLSSDFSSVSKSEHEIEKPVVEIGYSENPLAIPMPMPTMLSSSSDSQAAAANEKKRRYTDELMEKSIERRQKRMIKNRESAARSRAKKQAYTNELEDKKFRLQKTNNWLKKLKEVDAQLFSVRASLPRYQLRRTSSATF